MAQIETWYNQDLQQAVKVRYIDGNVFSADNAGNIIGVNVFDGGEPATLSGSVSGLVIRADGATVAVVGTLSGNQVSVALPQSAYAVPGAISVVVKLTDGETVTTLLAVVGVVYMSTTDTVVDPGTIIPDITTLVAEIEAAVASIPADYTDLWTSLAPNYSTSSAYAIGQYVTYNGGLYRCVTAIASGESWTAAHWTAANLGPDIAELKTGMINRDASDDYSYLATIGGIYVKSADGTEGTNQYIKCSDFVEFHHDIYQIEMYAKTGTSSINPLIVFYDENKGFLFAVVQSASYVTVTDGNAVIKLTSSAVPASVFSARYIRFNVSYRSADKNLVYFRMRRNNIGAIAGGGLVSDTRNVHNIPANSIAYKYSTNGSPLYLPYSSWMGNMVTVYGGNDITNREGMGILALGHGNRLHFCDKWSGSAWSEWTEFAKDTLTGKSYAGTFTSAQQQLQTDIILDANTSYIVRMNTPVTGYINVFGLGNNSNYDFVGEYKPECVLCNDSTRRYLVLYNVGGALDSVDISVIPLRSYLKPVDTYYVSLTNSNADYSSVTACFLDLKNNAKEKVVYIEGGDYDIYQEYVDANVPVYDGDSATSAYFPYCVWVPPNTHVIGQGIVRLKWMPTAQQVTKPQADTVSPLNVAASCTIENIEVHCKNGRYCLHNDGLGKRDFNGAIQIYRNVRFYKYTSDTDGNGQYLGFSHCTGFGIDRQMHHEYENCYFWNESTGRAFYGHARSVVGTVTLTERMSSDITLTNCVGETAGNVGIKLGNTTNSNLHIHVRFSSCYFNKRMDVIDETAGNNCPNAFDITMLNCNDIAVNISDADNPYPLKRFPPLT